MAAETLPRDSFSAGIVISRSRSFDKPARELRPPEIGEFRYPPARYCYSPTLTADSNRLSRGPHFGGRQQPPHDSFQLRLTGDCSTLVGRVEELRLLTLQEHLLQPNGCIRYLNTAGFAIRRARVNAEGFVFDPAALRAEDTLVLAILMLDGELPLFVSSAIVQHAISLSFTECILKGIWSAFKEGKTFDLIASKGVKIRVSHRERLTMLSAMWKTSRRQSIGRTAWFALVLRQSLRLIASYVYRLLRRCLRLTHLDRFFLKNRTHRPITGMNPLDRARVQIPENLSSEYQSKVR